MATWAYYDGNGNRLRKRDAKFAGGEVTVPSEIPAPPGMHTVSGVEDHDVHTLDAPVLRKTFKTPSAFRCWLADQAKH